MNSPLFSLPDRTPVEVRQEDLERHWGQLRYRGHDLIDAYLRYVPTEGTEDGQECFLGYHPYTDLFYVGFDGSCLGTISIGDDGSITEHDCIPGDSFYFYGRNGLYDEEIQTFPELIQLRLC